MDEETIKNEMTVVKGKVFDVIGLQDLVIEEMNKQYLPMKINGIDDKKGYKDVHDGLMLYVKYRNDTIRHGKKKREEAVAYQKAVIEEEKRVIGLMAPGENHLRAERDAIDNIQAAIKAEAEAKEAAKVQARIDRLESMGMGLIAGYYKLPYGADGVAVPVAILNACTDEQFTQFVGEIQAKKDAEAARLKAEEERRLEEQALILKVQQEQEAERQRLLAVKKEQEEAERKRLYDIAEESRKALLKERLETAEREKKEAAIRADAERVRKEREEWEAIKAQEARDIAAAKQKVIDDAKHAAELEKAKKEAVERARVMAEEKAKAEAEFRARTEEKARIAAEKRAARAPDKMKILLIADTLDVIQTPDVKTEEGRAIAASVMMDIAALIKSIRDKAEGL